MRQVVWELNDEDFREIKELYERKVALENLLKIIGAENDALKDKFVIDYGSVTRLFQEWWGNTSQKYNWAQIEGFSWSIDFNTQEVLLIEPA